MVFVFDIITRPDENGLKEFEKLNTQTKLSEEENHLNHEERPALFKKMQAWAGLWVENSGIPRHKFSWKGTDEKKGLIKLFESLQQYKDFGLVHFNGRSRHLPFITYKAMQYQLVLPYRLTTHDITYRYSNHNIDLRDTLSNYGANQPPVLFELIWLTGLPSHPFVSEKPEKDSDYDLESCCYQNVLYIYTIWLHLKHTNGTLKKDLFQNLKQRALQKIDDLRGDH